MDSAAVTAIVTCLVGGLMSAGGWKFYESVLKHRASMASEYKKDRSAYRDDLIKRVDKLEDEREELTKALIEIKTEFASMKVKLEFIEKENEILKLRLQNRD